MKAAWVRGRFGIDTIMTSPLNAALCRSVTCLAALLCAATPLTALADVKAGVDAWSRGDYAFAVREWNAAAENGDADAQFNLGQAYRLGRGVKTDSVRAAAFYAKAAAQGHVRAADILGVMLFESGQRAAALPYLVQGAVRGDARAQYLLGLATFNGDGIGRDWPRGYALVSLASAAGMAPATDALVQMDQYLSDADRAEAMRLMNEYAAAPAAPNAARPIGDAVTAASAAPSVKATGGAWMVQLGAFAVAGNTDRQWTKLGGTPALAGATRVERTEGALTVLLAGGFASREAAAAACKMLSASGTSCLVTR